MAGQDVVRFRSRKFFWLILLLSIAVIISVYLPLPYYVSRPGSAIELAPLIQVENKHDVKQGAFMLTTVRMGQANVAWYLYAKMSAQIDLIEKRRVVSEGESHRDYSLREKTVMQHSQQIAEAVAFQLAGYPVKVEDSGVWVLSTRDKYPAKDVLQVGDVIIRLDQEPIANSTELLTYLAHKRPGEQVTIHYERDGQLRQATVTLAQLPVQADGMVRAGLGIEPGDKQKVDIGEHKVTFTSHKIGGPSAGLMMTLEIYDQLQEELDLTRGYRVAGTGEIKLDGTVARIGGVRHKVVAADQAGAEIFFVPDNEDSTPSNYQEAVEMAKQISTAMKIVPVKTVEDAINYLKALPPKHQ